MQAEWPIVKMKCVVFYWSGMYIQLIVRGVDIAKREATDGFPWKPTVYCHVLSQKEYFHIPTEKLVLSSWLTNKQELLILTVHELQGVIKAYYKYLCF